MSMPISFALQISISFYFYLITGTLLFLTQQQRKPWCVLRMLGCTLCGLGFMVAIIRFGQPTSLNNIVIYGSALLLMVFASHFSFAISWSEALFCAIAGYGVQFIGSMIRECVHELSLPFPVLRELLLFLVTLALYAAFYFFYGRRLHRGQNFDLHQRYLLLLLGAAVMVEIILCYTLRTQWFASGDPVYMLADSVLLIISTLCILAVQFNLLLQHNLESEMQLISRMWQKDQELYRVSSETIDQINRKCHDMRHQIRTIGGNANVNANALKEMENAIRIYDAMFETGSRALDVILTEKSLLCHESGITINCIADGSSLNFMQDSDIYSLFGNLLENAINAVASLDAAERVIDLSIRRHGELLSINARNCYSGEITLRDGRPVSAGDSRNHGYGTKSMAAIADKYGGTISFRAMGGNFAVNMLFPLNETAQ